MFSFLYHGQGQHFNRTWLYIWVTCGCLIWSRNCFPFASTWVHPFFVGSVLLILLVFCIVLLCVFTFWVLCCDFRIKTMFGSSLLPVVCRRAHFLFTIFVFAHSSVQHMLCVCFVCLLLVYHMLPVSFSELSCLIAPSVFSSVYWKSRSDDLLSRRGDLPCRNGF